MVPKIFKWRAIPTTFGTWAGHGIVQIWNLDLAVEGFDLGSYDGKSNRYVGNFQLQIVTLESSIDALWATFWELAGHKLPVDRGLEPLHWLHVMGLIVVFSVEAAFAMKVVG